MSVELPADLIRPIIAYVRQNEDLYALALVSSTFREEAQRALFETIVIIIDGTRHLPLLNTIIASPKRLALMTRKATIELDLLADKIQLACYKWSGEADPGWFDEAGPKTRTALQLMSQLTSLRIICNSYNDRHLRLRPWMESLLESCGIRLKVLAWHVLNFDLRNLVLKNLAHKPDLIVLDISYEYKDVDFSEIQQHLGRIGKGLQTLTATWEIIHAALKNGAIIPHLHVIGQPLFAQPPAAAFQNALCHVATLWCSHSLQSLGVKPEDLRNLILLRTAWLPEQEYADIAALKKLRVLVLRKNFGSSLHSPEGLAQVVENLFRRSTSLTTIYVEFFADPVNPHPSHTCYVYDPSTGNINIRAVFPQETELWRHKSRLNEIMRSF